MASPFIKIAVGLVGATLLVGTSACSFALRDKKMWQEDTAKLLQPRNGLIKSCFDDVLKNNPKAGGKVVVSFKVEHGTGKVMDLTVDGQQTTASEELQACVTSNLKGLEMSPPDQKDGMATYTYDLTANPPPPPAPAPAPTGG